MCMLFAVSSEEKFESNEYLKLFYRNSSKHPHGWGLAYLDSGDMTVAKESICACESHYLKDQLSRPISSKLLLAHIRYATIGNVDLDNCHPFSGTDRFHRRWTMIHNGTIFDFSPLRPYTKTQSGETDSERIFLYLKDKINEHRTDEKPSFEERFSILDKIVCDMSHGNKLNLLFTDGKYLYVHTNCKDTLFFLEKEHSVIFSTAPLTDENWKRVTFCTLLAFKNGKLAAQGTQHTNEYIESPENMKLLYRIFSNL